MATWLSAPIWTQLEDEESFTATALAFNRRGTLAAAGTREGECCIYDTSTIVVRLRELDGVAGGAVTHLAFSCDSRFLAVADSGGTIALWDLAANVVARTFRDLAVANLCFHPDDAAVLLVSRWDAPPVLLDVSPGATEATHPPRTLRLADPYADADADAGTEGAEGDVGAEGGVGGGAGGLLEVGAGAEASKKKKKRKPLPMGSLEHHAIFSSNGRRIYWSRAAVKEKMRAWTTADDEVRARGERAGGEVGRRRREAKRGGRGRRGNGVCVCVCVCVSGYDGG